MSSITVYSCITGNYDQVSRSLLASTGIGEPGVRYVLYTDQVTKPDIRTSAASNISWECRPLVWRHPLCQRRTARWHKVNSHLLPDDAEFSIWVDGACRIKKISFREKLVVPMQHRYVLAVFKHPERTCVYQELQACIKRKKDNVRLMQQQVEGYRREGYPANNGMVETGCVFRRACPEVTAFNSLWWQQLANHSYRDQLSFNYTAWKLSQPYGIIPGEGHSSRFFEFVPHKHR